MTALMRAKMKVSSVVSNRNADGDVVNEGVNFHAVGLSKGYPADGSDEDNTYACFTPTGTLSLTIANPALFGKLGTGATFYVDFTPAD